MKLNTAVLFSFLFFCFFAQFSEISAQKKKITAKASATAKVANDKKNEPSAQPTPPNVQPSVISSSNQQITTEIFNEINLFRSDPSAYVKFLEEFKDKFDGNYLQVSSTSKILTKEGVSAVDEAINEISNTKPLKPLIFSTELSKAADDHVKDMIEKSFFSHRGSDGNTPDFRFAKYLNISLSEIRENLALGNKSAREFVITWLVDDGSIKRGNRLSLVSPTLKYIGISTGLNKENNTLAVATFSSDNRK